MGHLIYSCSDKALMIEDFPSSQMLLYSHPISRNAFFRNFFFLL